MRNSIQAQKPSFNSEQVDDMQLPPNQKTNEIPLFEKKKNVTNQNRGNYTQTRRFGRGSNNL